MGKVRGDAIQCPYHGWEWAAGDGACTRIPSLADQSQIPRRARIPAFPAREQWGLVWTVLEEPVSDLPTLPWFDADAWTWGHGPPFELPVALGVMIENFRDVAHFAFVHDETLGPVPEVIEPLQPERDGIEVTLRREMTFGEGAGRRSGARRARSNTTRLPPTSLAFRMFTETGERCLLHAAPAVSATESAHYWIEGGLAEGFDESVLEEAIEFEWRVYSRGPADRLGGRAARAAAGAGRGRQYPRRRLHACLPGGVPRVRRSGARATFDAGGRGCSLNVRSIRRTRA